MFKEEFSTVILRTVSASFSGVMSFVLNLACIEFLSARFSDSVKVWGLSISVSMQVVLIVVLQILFLVKHSLGKAQYWEIDKLHSLTFVTYFMVALGLWVVYFGNPQFF